MSRRSIKLTRSEQVDYDKLAYEFSKAVPNKLLNPDGSITTFDGSTVISPADETNKLAYDLSPAIPNKSINPDGSITTLDGEVIKEASEEGKLIFTYIKSIANRADNPDGTTELLSDIISGGSKEDLTAVLNMQDQIISDLKTQVEELNKLLDAKTNDVTEE